MNPNPIISSSRVGVYVDVANLSMNGGYHLQYGVLRDFACRDGAEPVRLNAYVAFDVERAKRDLPYRTRTNGFHSMLRDQGFKIVTKEVHWYQDEGGKYARANADLDMAVDALLQAQNLDRVLIASGDGDFVRVVQVLQNRGCRVEVVGLDNVSQELRQEADLYLSGYLIPNLVPIESDDEQPPAWGEVNSRVRGWCYWHNQNYGFMRYLKTIGPGLWLTDARSPGSPYATAFFHDSNLPTGAKPELLPNRSLVFEFTLVESERGLQAVEITLAGRSRPTANDLPTRSLSYARQPSELDAVV
ncbi:MAG: NYN domain-containing protein [Chloroflexota bacterium]